MKKSKIPEVSKPRDPIARAVHTRSEAGIHVDKKKAVKNGVIKYKKGWYFEELFNIVFQNTNLIQHSTNHSISTSQFSVN